MNDHDAIGNFRDWRQATELLERLSLDGWSLSWERLDDGDWLARVSCPALPGGLTGRGRSRVSAISAAHVESIRRLESISGSRNRRELVSIF